LCMHYIRESREPHKILAIFAKGHPLVLVGR